MLIRHDCCGVSARGSGGGTPCATRLRRWRRSCPAIIECMKTHRGQRVTKLVFLGREINIMYSQTACSCSGLFEGYGRVFWRQSPGFLLSFFGSEAGIWVFEKMRGTTLLMCYYRFINWRANCDINKLGSSESAFLRMGAWKEFIMACTFIFSE